MLRVPTCLEIDTLREEIDLVRRRNLALTSDADSFKAIGAPGWRLRHLAGTCREMSFALLPAMGPDGKGSGHPLSLLRLGRPPRSPRVGNFCIAALNFRRNGCSKGS